MKATTIRLLAAEAVNLEAALAGATVVVQEWDWSRFAVLDVFQAAPRNGGQVELLQDTQSKELFVAKVMPLCWTCGDHEKFVETYPEETEMPWRDVCVTQYLDQRLGEPHVCKFFGIFRRSSKGQDAGGGGPCDALQEHAEEGEHCLVLSYCRGGDLFTWLERSRSIDVVASREQLARPLIHETLRAASSVHRLGVSHGDLSLENILLFSEKAQLPPDIRLVDFACACGPRACGPRGKSPYQAPEMHCSDGYCTVAADVFALGVVVFALVVGNYPWKSTKPNTCQFFRYFKEFGLQAFLVRRRVKTQLSGLQPLSVVLSHEVIDLLQGLLCVDPLMRMQIPTALEHEWFQQV